MKLRINFFATTISILGLFIVILSSCACNKAAVQTISHRNKKLVWSDEFDAKTNQIDGSKWAFDMGNGTDGWGNQELEYYTNRTENAQLDGQGHLVITAQKEAYNGSAYTSARLKTQNIYDCTYGRIEARIKTPFGTGLWPAFWMLGANVDKVGWPECGEIDIMELRGQTPNIIASTLHGPGYNGGNGKTKSYGLQNDRFDKDFHVFAVEWTNNQIDFFVDDFLYFRVKPEDLPGKWVFDHSFFIILNLAVGGNYVGNPNDITAFPQKMYVDYVRVYQFE